MKSIGTVLCYLIIQLLCRLNTLKIRFMQPDSQHYEKIEHKIKAR